MYKRKKLNRILLSCATLVILLGSAASPAFGTNSTSDAAIDLSRLDGEHKEASLLQDEERSNQMGPVGGIPDDGPDDELALGSEGRQSRCSMLSQSCSAFWGKA